MKDKSALKRKIKRNMIISLVVLSILFVAVLVFILYLQAYSMLWTLSFFIVLILITLFFDKSKIKEIEEDNEDKPV